ncbi:Formate dehydrogenase-N subunit beta [Serratia fonticola]|uniref:Formate dehydrogenase-N subunit beta n=1 Tax=Serratia fonticola TaxID=47917 RepID=A0A4U9TSC6_SERFO|nr:Formate dehydrogenase-N subunit beta [Serratia fonticola]
MSMQSQDIIKRSATNTLTPPPQARDYKVEVAKLIDVSTCIGCKACQVGLFRVERHSRRSGPLRRGL